jgi:hypothetical protein
MLAALDIRIVHYIVTELQAIHMFSSLSFLLFPWSINPLKPAINIRSTCLMFNNSVLLFIVWYHCQNKLRIFPLPSDVCNGDALFSLRYWLKLRAYKEFCTYFSPSSFVILSTDRVLIPEKCKRL